MKLALSRLVPVHFTTVYRPAGGLPQKRATWWQWRGRCFGAKHQPVAG